MRTFEETADGDMATHVEDSVDPVRDLEIIRDELRLKARRQGMQREDAGR